MHQGPQLTTSTDQLKSDLREYGFGILGNVLDADTTAALRERVLEQGAAEVAQGAATKNLAIEPEDNVNQWVVFLPNKGRVFRKLINSSPCLETVRHVLGNDAIVSEFSAHITWPGNKDMPLHTDQWWMPHPVMPGDPYPRTADVQRSDSRFGSVDPAERPINPPVVCNVMWAITDFTVENGATRLVPGSHQSGVEPDPDKRYDVVQAQAPAGSFLVWEGRTWHAASQNNSNGPRVGITTTWAAPFCRQLINFTHGLRPDVVAELTEHERSVLGYKVWTTYGSTGDFAADWASPGAENLGELR